MFVVGINNLGKAPLEFRVAQVEANQVVGGQDFQMTVVTYEMLAQEEKTRQVAAAILRSRGWCKCLRCVASGLRQLHHSKWTNWILLQSDGCGNCPEHSRSSERSNDRRYDRARASEHGRA